MEDQDYLEWDKKVEEAKKHNNTVLLEFDKYLKAKSLKAKTIKKHIDNIEFFANSYLTRYEIIPIEEGYADIGGFLGDFFIRKAGWASKYAIKENIASFKKFYSYLNKIGKISAIDLHEMKEFIKEEKEYWLSEFDDYWNGVSDEDWI